MIEVEPVHFSRLTAIDLSPAHYLEGLLTEWGDTAPMRIGRGTHSLALGGPEVVCFPHIRRGKEWEAFRRAHPGAEILSTSEMRVAEGAAAALRRHRAAMRLLESARLREHEFEWFRAGFRCAGRLDFARPGEFVADLKIVRSSHPEAFARQAIRMRYHAQMPWYQYGLAQNGLYCPAAYLVAIESAPPHPVVVRPLTARALEEGDRLCDEWLEKLRQCQREDLWPGYSEEPIDLDVEPDSELAWADDEGEEIEEGNEVTA